MVGNSLNLYMVYWRNNERKALVKGENEEEAIKEAQRFAGKYTKISKIEKIDLDIDERNEDI